ncbi:MAG: DUF7266 family protein [Natronomonas sp.]
MANVTSPDDRGVSPVFAYALTLGIGTLLVAGLILAASGFVDDQREMTTRSELQVVGQQLAGDVGAADRLARAGEDRNVTITRDLPERVVGSPYSIYVRTDDAGPTDTYLELSTADPDVSVEIGLAVETEIQAANIGGGRVIVSLDHDPDILVMRNG